MKLYLQFGHGMMAHTKDLLSKWGGDGGLILSPRDLEVEQLRKFAKGVHRTGGEILIDPQCYVREADHHRLVGHDHWAAIRTHTTSGLLSGSGTGELMVAVERMNADVSAGRRIIPGLLAQDVDDDWFAFQSHFIQEAQRWLTRPMLATIAVGSQAMCDEAKMEAIIERAERWPVDGFYVVAETPPGQYLVDDPNWLANLLILVSGLRLLGRFVLVGYSNHQELSLACANADAIASGTWLNVRSFSPDKFFERDDDEISRRAKGGWYYCPQALSEYKMPFLDVALRGKQLASMRPVSPIPSRYCAPLFAGAQPSSVNWGEQNAFRHYLDCLHAQVGRARQASFDSTVGAQHVMLDTGERLLKRLRSAGVLGQDRDFINFIDVSRSALALHGTARGPRLRRNW
jgi:hypothetical protein